LIYTQRVVEKKSAIYQSEKIKDISKNVGARVVRQEFLKKIEQAHKYLGLKLLTQTQSEKLCSLSPLDQTIKDELPRFGLVEDKTLKFIHQTFAEYFLAKFLFDQLMHVQQDVAVQELLLVEILIKPKHQIVRAFLNDQLAIKQPTKEILTIYGDKINHLWRMRKIKELFFGTRLVDESDNTFLHRAVQERNRQLLNFLLESLEKHPKTLRSLVTAKNYSGDMALHIAADKGDFDLIDTLITKGKADINAPDRLDRTILHRAAKQSKWVMVQQLINHQYFDVNAQTKQGVTVLHEAAKQGNLAMAAWLVTEKHINLIEASTAILWASGPDRWTMVHWLIDQGMPINTADTMGTTVLYDAIVYGNLETVQSLIAKGANCNIKKTQIFIKDPPFIRTVLLTLRSELPQRNDVFEVSAPPIYWAAREGSSLAKWDIIEWLIKEGGADINLLSFRQKREFLQLAQYANREEVVKFVSNTFKICLIQTAILKTKENILKIRSVY
jgi:ankyrin repeat protein